MKKSLPIRVLSGLTFFIFLCPFFQMCSDESMMKVVNSKEIAIPEGMSEAEAEDLYAEQRKQQKAEREKTFQESRKKQTYNAYQLALFPFAVMDEYIIEDLLEPPVYAYLC